MSAPDKVLEGLVRQTTDGKLQWRRNPASSEFVKSINATPVVAKKASKDCTNVPPHYQSEIVNEEEEITARQGGRQEAMLFTKVQNIAISIAQAASTEINPVAPTPADQGRAGPRQSNGRKHRHRQGHERNHRRGQPFPSPHDGRTDRPRHPGQPRTDQGNHAGPPKRRPGRCVATPG